MIKKERTYDFNWNIFSIFPLTEKTEGYLHTVTVPIENVPLQIVFNS